MKAPRRPVWSEGMLLAPQHLQALDRYHEALLAARLGGLAAQDWGVVSAAFDGAALSAGQLRVVQLAAILPDGTAVGFEEGDAEAPAPRPIADHFPAAAKSLDVYLAVARERDGVPAFADEASASRIRYAVASRPLEDATAPGQPLAVQMARPNAVVLFGDEPRDDFDCLKIAEVVRSPAGQPMLAPTYVPPCLRISASPWLMASLRDLQTRILAKQRDLLGGGRRGPEMTGTEVARLFQLTILSTHAPVVAHLAEAGDASPRETYLELASLASQLAALAGDGDAAGLPKLAPADLRSTFEPLVARLQQLLGGLAAAQHLVVPLEKRAGGLYLGRLTDEAVLRAALYLAVQSDLPEQQVAEAIPRLCKVASTAEIQGLIQAAAPGMVLQWLSRPPPQLSPKQGVHYFSLATGDRYWQGVLSNRAIAIYVPPPFDPARTGLELLAVPAAGQASGGAPAPRPPEVKRF